MCPVTLVSQLMPLLLVWHHPKGAQALRNRPGGKEGGRGRRHIATEDLFQGEMEGGRGGQRSDKDHQDQKLVTDHSSATPNW